MVWSCLDSFYFIFLNEFINNKILRLLFYLIAEQQTKCRFLFLKNENRRSCIFSARMHWIALNSRNVHPQSRAAHDTRRGCHVHMLHMWSGSPDAWILFIVCVCFHMWTIAAVSCHHGLQSHMSTALAAMTETRVGSLPENTHTHAHIHPPMRWQHMAGESWLTAGLV